MKKFVLPIGLDGKTLLDPLTKSIETLEKIQNESKETGKALNDAFNQGATAVDKIEEKIKPLAKTLENASKVGKQMGKELYEAFSAKNVDPSKLEKALAGFKDKLNIKSKIEVDIDSAKLAIFEKQMNDAKNGVDELKVALNMAQEIMKNLDSNSEEFAELAKNIEFVENAIKEFDESFKKGVEATFEDVYGQTQPLSARLGELEDRMYELAFAGKQNTEEFKNLQTEATRMRKTIIDVDAAVDTFAESGKTFEALAQGASALAGGFAVAQGAAALFGEENEEIEKALLKVNAAMAILQGLQEVSAILNKDSAFNIMFLSKARTSDVTATGAQTVATGANTVATTAGTVATKALGLALKGLGIGLIIGAILYLVTNWDKLRASLDKFLPVGKKTGDLFGELKAIIMGVGTAIFEGLIAPFKILEKLITEGLDAAVDQAKESYNVIDNYEKGYQKQSIQNALDHANEQKQIRLDNWDSALKIQEAEGRDTYASRVKWYENRIKLMKLEDKETKELTQELLEFQAKKRGEDRKAAEAASKKAAEDAKKKREEAKKAAEEFYKQQNALELKYTREIAKLTIDSMADGLEKERAKINEDAKVRLEDLRAEGAKRKDAVARMNELELQLKIETQRKLKEADDKFEQERIAIQMQALRLIADAQEEGFSKEREISRLEHENNLKDIEKDYAQVSELKISLLAIENERYKKEQEKINLEQRQEQITLEEEKAIIALELMQKSGKKTEEMQRNLNLGILNINRQAAEKQVELLLKSGKDQNSIEVLRAKQIVNNFKNAIAEELDGKPFEFDWVKFFGIGKGIPGFDSEKFKKAVAESMKVMKDFTGFMIESYQEQIDKKQEQIDQTQEDIEKLEDDLDVEKQLRADGLANNVETVEAELALKRKEKDEQLAQQQELLDKKKQMQKVQLALDTAEQLSGLITASVNIYKGFSTIPIVGIPLAIAMIATMFGTFVASKAKAVQEINNQKVSAFGEGGRIDGKGHNEGGVKYYSNDNSGVIELEGNEYVTRKSSYEKYKGLVEAINKDDFSNLSIMDIAAMGMFQRMGVSYIPKGFDETIDDTNLVMNYSNVNVGGNFGKMDENLEYLANAKKNEVERWETDTHVCTKRGTKTTRLRKE